MDMKIRVLVCLFLAAGCASHYHERTAAGDIDRFVETTTREIPDLPSVGVAAVIGNRPVYLKNAETAYYIGSTTKAYTGLACAILADRGLLDLDAPTSKYLPETGIGVPLRAFLTHTSALENNGIVFRTAYSGEHSPQQLVSLLAQSKPSKPGFRYDNLGYVVASLIIERITGKPWQQALDELVFQPLGMRHTTAYMSVAKKWPMAKPYQRNRAGDVMQIDFEKIDQTMHAAGGIVTTPADLARWLEANLAKGKVDGKQVIPIAAFEQAQAMQIPTTIERGDFKGRGYAFGWYHADFHGERALFHGGGYQGWHSQFSMLPDKRIGVGVMTNVNGTPDDAADLIAAYIYDRLLEKPNVEAEYAKRLADLKARVARMRAGFIEEVRKRAQRPWTLQHAAEAYVGRYDNPMYGTVVIEQRGDKLYASLGRLSSIIEAFTEPETGRVELVPGSGEVLLFKFGTGPNAEAVMWGDDAFTRIASPTTNQ